MSAEGAENDNKMVIGVTEKIEVKVAKADSNTVLLVVVLVMGVGLIFICFAMVAICYRCLAACTGLCIMLCLCREAVPLVYIEAVYLVYLLLPGVNRCLVYLSLPGVPLATALWPSVSCTKSHLGDSNFSQMLDGLL